jgi:hypothetical protein
MHVIGVLVGKRWFGFLQHVRGWEHEETCWFVVVVGFGVKKRNERAEV